MLVMSKLPPDVYKLAKRESAGCRWQSDEGSEWIGCWLSAGEYIGVRLLKIVATNTLALNAKNYLC